MAHKGANLPKNPPDDHADDVHETPAEQTKLYVTAADLLRNDEIFIPYRVALLLSCSVDLLGAYARAVLLGLSSVEDGLAAVLTQSGLVRLVGNHGDEGETLYLIPEDGEQFDDILKRLDDLAWGLR